MHIILTIAVCSSLHSVSQEQEGAEVKSITLPHLLQVLYINNCNYEKDLKNKKAKLSNNILALPFCITELEYLAISTFLPWRNLPLILYDCKQTTFLSVTVICFHVKLLSMKGHFIEAWTLGTLSENACYLRTEPTQVFQLFYEGPITSFTFFCFL